MSDILAPLIEAFGVEGAMALGNRWDADTVNGIIHQINQLRVPPEERLKRYLKQQAKQYFDQNPDELRRIMAI